MRPLILLAVVLMVIGATWGLVLAPTEAFQSTPQRIMYVHVPSVLAAYVALLVTGAGSALFLWRREARWDRLAQGSAELGVLFLTMTLLSGAIWGRSVWGTWWAWDARLSTTLILWFIYVGYLIVRAWAPGHRGARAAAVIGILGVLDIPIIHWSVDFLRTLHPQATVLRPQGGGLPRSMLMPLAVNNAAFIALYAAMLMLRVRQEYALGALVERLEREG
jgi:heme exporter protein C